jgi:hypothetical protein
MREFIGRVTKGPFAKGSKSEHNAVCLDTGKASYVLRRQGGNPFQDPQLLKLVGKRIRCEGELSGYTLIMATCKVLNEQSE